jgi:DNA repair protein RadD
VRKTLYKHQQEAVNAAMLAVKEGHTPYLSVSTGGGKSLILAHFIDKAMKQGIRVLTLVPSKELCEQNYIEAHEYVSDPQNIGICCSKLNKFQVHKQSVIATYTSFLRRRATSGKFEVLLIDEAHLVGYDPKSSFRKIITSLKRINPALKIIGVTATPVRMLSGRLEEKYLDFDPVFSKCAYETSVQDLIKQGILSHVESISGDIQVDLSDVPIKCGDYDTEIASVKFDAILPHAIPDLKIKVTAYKINTMLIFASNVANARKIIDEWNGDNIRLIYGEMSSVDRVHIINWLKHGEGVRVVVNVNVLLVGFNFQKLDAVCFLRATKSLALYRQAVGRVLRSHEEKTIGFVIDYSGNIEEHGPIDCEIPVKAKKRRSEAPKKICTAIVEETIEFEGLTYRKGDECGYANILSAKKCKVCSAEFVSESEDGRYVMRTRAQILELKQEQSKITYAVDNVCFSKHTKEGRDMIKVEFFTKDYNDMDELICADYIMLDSSGSAGGLAIAKIKRIMKNPRQDWRKIQQFENGANTKNVLFLLNEYYEQFFKEITGVVTMRNGRFVNVVEYLT